MKARRSRVGGFRECRKGRELRKSSSQWEASGKSCASCPAARAISSGWLQCRDGVCSGLTDRSPCSHPHGVSHADVAESRVYEARPVPPSLRVRIFLGCPFTGRETPVSPVTSLNTPIFPSAQAQLNRQIPLARSHFPPALVLLSPST